ncbi:hypothetical protein SNOG_06474 [Parastagonospora nodorum SN15]|uniref:Uncharacterized protein n=1 Tax=Phaeosphaeria nodorum (strain SN15 / ATCC MYA-4574 / FGSC 10173) TaxID=321614 RepID=Q0UP40_PHANO|nr:hypothetical protein SNOG_06474 [Parastagonospora nodorum SN15]EAT86305.1 hypothetical protein SNOG_06474 [Parastagonospora nodorum SN15]
MASILASDDNALSAARVVTALDNDPLDPSSESQTKGYINTRPLRPTCSPEQSASNWIEHSAIIATAQTHLW